MWILGPLLLGDTAHLELVEGFTPIRLRRTARWDSPLDSPFPNEAAHGEPFDWLRTDPI